MVSVPYICSKEWKHAGDIPTLSWNRNSIDSSRRDKAVEESLRRSGDFPDISAMTRDGRRFAKSSGDYFSFTRASKICELRNAPDYELVPRNRIFIQKRLKPGFCIPCC